MCLVSVHVPGFCEETFLVMIPLCMLGNHSHMTTPLAGSATGMSGKTGGLNPKLRTVVHVYEQLG